MTEKLIRMRGEETPKSKGFFIEVVEVFDDDSAVCHRIPLSKFIMREEIQNALSVMRAMP